MEAPEQRRYLRAARKHIERHFGAILDNRRCRKLELVMVRKWVSYTCVDLLGMTLNQAGKMIGRDHATVLFHTKDIRNKLQIYQKVRDLKYNIEKAMLLNEREGQLYRVRYQISIMGKNMINDVTCYVIEETKSHVIIQVIDADFEIPISKGKIHFKKLLS